MSKIYTSSGVITNPEKPRVGIVSAHSLQDWIYDEIHNGIDLTFEDFLLDLKNRGLF